jgi:DNA polymerase-1
MEVADLSNVDEVLTLVPPKAPAKRVIEEIIKFTHDPVVAYDLETSRTRPYYDDARVLSVSLATDSRALAFCFDHPVHRYSDAERRDILSFLRNVLQRSAYVPVHNTAFDLEWTLDLYDGDLALARSVPWVDTMVQGYVLDERSGGGVLGLHSLCVENLGVRAKDLAEIDHRFTLTTDPMKLLRYGALDGLNTARLFAAQEARLAADGLGDVFELANRRVASFTLATYMGVPVDQKRRERFDAELTEKARAAQAALLETSAVDEFRRRFGPYNPDSGPHNIRLFRDVLGREEVENSTPESVLKALKDCPEAALLLEHRHVTKLKGTYVDKLDPSHPETHLWPDGMLHARYSTVGTRSGRSASNSPNMQNYPARRDAEIREMIVAPPGFVIVASDYGQIEWRVGAMASGDEKMVRALWSGEDIHAFWTERFIEIWPRYLAKHNGVFKSARKSGKNQLVFPKLYGAGTPKIANLTGAPESVAEQFVREFEAAHDGIVAWQKGVEDFYRMHGYVECLTGRRRRGPLSKNMILNTGIQGTASDIVVDAMDRLVDKAHETGDWFYATRIQVHDDLTCFVPEDRLEEGIETIVRTMLDVPFSFVNVPITVEVEYGTDWANLKTLDTFSSDKDL